MTTLAAPDERAFAADVAKARFQIGVDDGRWRVVDLAWPHALIAVSAAPRPGAPSEFLLRFELTGYPQHAPTAAMWDCNTNALLAADVRPKGGAAQIVFRADWQEGRALYLPCDRVALEGHDQNWPAAYVTTRWTPDRDIAFYLRIVSEVLHDDEYLGI